jgi:hypothetical protein
MHPTLFNVHFSLNFCTFSITSLVENKEFTGFQEFSAPRNAYACQLHINVVGDHVNEFTQHPKDNWGLLSLLNYEGTLSNIPFLLEANYMSDKNNGAEAAGYAAAGAAAGGAAGAGFFAWIGGMGLAVGGTALSIGMAPVIAAGTVAGLAAYGVKKALEDDD